MKKIKLILSIVLIIVMSFLLVCCNTQPNPDDLSQLIVLPSPTVICLDDIVSWNQVDQAQSYDVYVDGALVANTSGTFYLLEEEGEHVVYVIAKGDGTNTASSARSNKVVCKVEHKLTNQEVFTNFLLQDGAWEYDGTLNDAIEYVQEKQSLDADLFADFESVFTQHLDNDGGYRGEFWGKTLRGAVMCYRYTQNEQLYELMHNTVAMVMSSQEANGRISSTDQGDNEFAGWNLWGRTYVVIGMLQFYSICKDQAFKSQIIDCCKGQLDYIMERVGEDKIDILTLSADWGGLPCTRILQAYISMYCLTNEQRYLDYSEFLISTGGCTMLSAEGRTILEDCMLKTPMYKWGCRKVYEVTNFFDGILMYYMVTGDQYTKKLALNYFEVLSATEITETGGVATDVEEANNASVEQSNPSNLGRMQENCVIGVWMRYCQKIYLLFDIPQAIDYIERAYYNVVLGTIDYDNHFGLPFFSYSPCGCTTRTTQYSGGAHVNGRFYSCCVAMGSLGLAIVPQMSVTKNADGISANMYFNGSVNATTPSGKSLKLLTTTEIPTQGNGSIRIGIDEQEFFTVRLRIPDWADSASIRINGVLLEGVQVGGYYTISRTWKNGDTITYDYQSQAHLIHGSAECSNKNAQYNVVVKKGPLVFARDYRIEGDKIFEPAQFVSNGDILSIENTTVAFRNQLAIKVLTADGYVTLVDYASAGKTQSDDSIMCLWIPTVDYWSQDLTKNLVVRSFTDGSPNFWGADGVLKSAQSYKGETDPNVLANFAWKFIKVEGVEGAYRILDVASGGYLTVHANGYLIINHSEKIDSDSQYFYLRQVGLNRYKIVGKYGKVLTVHDQTYDTYMFEDINHDLQYWYLQNI